MSGFDSLPIAGPILEVLAAAGFRQPTPVQQQALPPLVAGNDVIVHAATGSGKTIAYGVPLVQAVAMGPAQARGLVMVPTRELAEQVAKVMDALGRAVGVATVLVTSGSGRAAQGAGLNAGDRSVVIATPGRLLAWLDDDPTLLAGVGHLVIDEIDRLLDDGFREQLDAIIPALASRRQTALVSATLTPVVRDFANAWQVTPIALGAPERPSLATGLEYRAYPVTPRDKAPLLVHLLKTERIKRALVFCRSRKGVERLARILDQQRLGVQALHGDRTPAQRRAVIDRVHGGRIRVLVATDLAARGLDLPVVTHVIHRDIPDNVETWVHRSGRTARAGRSGCAWALVDGDERPRLHRIEAELGLTIPLATRHPFAAAAWQPES